MEKLLAIPLLLLTALSMAQAPSALPSSEALLSSHFGAAPSGQPASLTWKPQGNDAQQFIHLEFGTVITTVDTIFYPTADLALVLFRTVVQREEDEWDSMCMLCEDWLGLARYQKKGGAWTVVDFKKWFHKQGVYGGTHKPELVEAGTKARALRIISSDGEPEESSITHYFLGLPDLKPVLSIVTEGFEVTRGGPHGPMDAMVFREYRFIPSDKEWFDVELSTRTEEGGEGSISHLSYATATKTYGPLKTVSK